jgi:hypothetical protein
MPLRRAHLAGLIGVCLLGCLAAPAGAGTPRIGLNFTAGRFRVDSNNFPPNAMCAAGPSTIVELINGRYSVFSKLDGSLLQTRSLGDFWSASGAGPTGNYPYDPRVLFDPFTQRWYASSADGNMAFNPTGQSDFLFAVSNTSDPTQGWTGFSIAADANHAQWADFPMLGFNRDSVVLTSNLYAIGDANYPQTSRAVLVLPKAGLLAPTPTVAGATRLEYAPVAFASQPTVDLDNTGLPTTLWSANGFPGRLLRAKLSGPADAPTISPALFVGMASYGDPPDAPQPGGKASFETYDRRLGASVVLRDGVAWGVQTVSSGGRAAVHWFKVDEANNVLLQQGLISDGTLSYYYPSIGVNESGDAVIGFSGSSTDVYMSAFAAVGDTEGGLTTFGEAMLLKAGTATFEVLDSFGRNRGGDYSATVADPNDPLAFWTIQEVVLATNEWDTQITEILVPEPGALLLLCAGAATALLRRRGRRA